MDKFIADLFKDNIVGAVRFFGTLLLNSIGIYFLWSWFMPKDPITLPQATGLVLILGLIGFFQFPISKLTDRKERNKEDWGRLFSEVSKVALYLIFGYGLKYFFL